MRMRLIERTRGANKKGFIYEESCRHVMHIFIFLFIFIDTTTKIKKQEQIKKTCNGAKHFT